MLYQHVKILPVVLSHEAKQGKESPPKTVKTGVAIVGVPSGFHTHVALRTPSKRTHRNTENIIYKELFLLSVLLGL